MPDAERRGTGAPVRITSAWTSTSSGLEPYQRRLQARFGSGTLSRALSGILPAGVGTVLGRHLLAVPAFVRHVVVDRWFLHRYDAALGTNS